jgi:type II secretory pathway pseudopilin PulG
MRRAFTLVEMLVAVVLLIAIIVATGKIFATARQVASVGEASADVLQQASLLREQLQRDLDRLSRDGYVAIQCVVVRNDVNRTWSASAPLLNPILPATAMIRCDQLVFFTSGMEGSARWAGPGDLATSGGGQQSRAARVYYGHGIQVPGLLNDPLASSTVNPDQNRVRPIITGVVPTPTVTNGGRMKAIVPWTWWDPAGASGAPRVGWRYGSSTEATSGALRISPNQPEARSWVLARKSVLLSDDGGRPTYYPDPPFPGGATLADRLGASSVTSIFGDRSYAAPQASDVGSPDVESSYLALRNRNRVPASAFLIPNQFLQSGWVDIAASDLGKVRRTVAPNLRLSNPVALCGSPYLSSIVVPWFTLANNLAPQSWPVGASAPAWPSGTQVTVVGNNGDQLPVSAYSSQRDRIMRGTFGIPSVGFITFAAASGTSPGLLGWPRAEKYVGNTDRKSEMLLASTLLTNCSSFQVDWTWEPLTGRQTDSAGKVAEATPRVVVGANCDLQRVTPATQLRGYEPFASAWPAGQDVPSTIIRRQPWFGFPDRHQEGAGGSNGFSIPVDQQIGVCLAQDINDSMPDVVGDSPEKRTNYHMRSVAQAIEGLQTGTEATQPVAVKAPFGTEVPVRVYTAVFGFNQEEAFTVTPDGINVARDDFTPWPTEIRVTCTLHDPRLVLERGREFQFVLSVPKRRKE